MTTDAARTPSPGTGDGLSPDGDDTELDFIPLCDPDISDAEVGVVGRVLTAGSLNNGHMTHAFEEAFADTVGRAHGVAVPSGTIGMLMILRALGIGPGDEVLCSPYGWHQAQQAVALSGATPVLVDIDYWQHTINPAKAAEKITPATKAVIAANVNGHPAHWDELQSLAEARNLVLIEDSTESIGSVYKGRVVGSFGLCSLFDFSEPGILLAGGGGMIVTDDRGLAHELRYLRQRETEHRYTVGITRRLPLQASLSNVNAALGLVQVKRLPEIIAKRDQVIRWYDAAMASFEGIKPPYKGPGAETVNPMVYAVHLGTRFTASGRKAIIEDMDTHAVDTSDYGQPLYTQQYYVDRGYNRADYPVCQKTADRAIALPLHHKVTQDQIAFIVDTLKDATVNTGAGAAIYL